MSEPLNDHDTVQPLYADLYWGGHRDGASVQVTMVGTIQAQGGPSYDGAAYLSVPAGYFRDWLREVSANLDKLEPAAAAPSDEGSER